MNGLQVVQTEFVAQTAFLQSAPGTAPNTPTGGIIITTCMEPANLLSAMTQINSGINLPSGPNVGVLLEDDQKFYLRQYKSTGFLQNISNTPLYLKRITFYVRKNIAISDYPNYASLLQDGSILINNPLAEITTGNNAQRLLKFGKTKWIHMPCGAIRRYKINTKYYSPKVISKNVEANTQYLATKYTKGYFWKVIPCVNQHYTGTLPNINLAGSAWASWLVACRGVDYVSGYVQGYNDPRSYFNPVALPSSATRFSIFTDQEARIQAAFVPAQ
jgi:hypothetical protein